MIMNRKAHVGALSVLVAGASGVALKRSNALEVIKEVNESSQKKSKAPRVDPDIKKTLDEPANHRNADLQKVVELYNKYTKKTVVHMNRHKKEATGKVTTWLFDANQGKLHGKIVTDNGSWKRKEFEQQNWISYEEDLNEKKKETIIIVNRHRAVVRKHVFVGGMEHPKEGDAAWVKHGEGKVRTFERENDEWFESERWEGNWVMGSKQGNFTRRMRRTDSTEKALFWVFTLFYSVESNHWSHWINQEMNCEKDHSGFERCEEL